MEELLMLLPLQAKMVMQMQARIAQEKLAQLV